MSTAPASTPTSLWAFARYNPQTQQWEDEPQQISDIPIYDTNGTLRDIPADHVNDALTVGGGQHAVPMNRAAKINAFNLAYC